MNTDFDFFTFAIFIGCEFEQFTKTVIDVSKETLDKGKAILVENLDLNLEQYKNPDVGWHLEHYSWWQSEKNRNIVFLSSNQSDGLDVYCRIFRKQLKCELVMCRVSTKKSCDINHFSYLSVKGEERVVMALKENRWTFYQEGTPLPFEDLSLYENKRIKDRINMDVILKYLNELGIDFDTMDSCVTKCSSYEHLKPGL